MTDIPEGFELFETGSPFNQLVGPYYYRLIDDSAVFGMRVEKRHCNSGGRLHGSMICAIADIALGNNVGLALSKAGRERKTHGDVMGAPISTVGLSTDFTGSAKEGDWIEVHVDVHKTGNRLVFANAYLSCDISRFARVSGVYNIIEKRLN